MKQEGAIPARTPSPGTGFYFRMADADNARAAISRCSWASSAFDRLKTMADEVMKFPDSLLTDFIIGMKDEAFAYGTSGCPCCGKPFPARQDALLAVLSDPREGPGKTIVCPSCRTVLPNETFPDAGRGLEVGGKSYYLIGLWNFAYGGWLLGGVRDEEGIATKLTYLYMLTGDERYARKAIVILDAFAAIAAGSVGPRDFTPFGSQVVKGRLHMLTSIVHRVKKYLAMDYDWLSALPEMDALSPALERLGEHGTVRGNIKAMLHDYMLGEPGGVSYDLRGGHLANLQNHEIDGVKAMLAVGLALGVSDYLIWGVQAAEAMLYNTIGRDSMYYEGSLSYSLSTADRLLDVALMAMRASTAEQLAAHHPFSSERFYRYAVKNPIALLCQGHFPSFGDGIPDTRTGREPETRILIAAYRAALYFNYFGTEAMRRIAEADAATLYPLVCGKLGGNGKDLFFANPQAFAQDNAGYAFKLPAGNTVMGQAGIVVLRDRHDTTAMLRFGPNNVHTHDDVLALKLYACGMEVSADVGYMYYRSNGHLGWASKAISHNTVVVDRDDCMKESQLYKPFAGGELSFVAESEHVTATEVKAPKLYGIDKYQRAFGIVALDGGGSYAIDWFTVEGAETADYAFHAFHEPSELKWSDVNRIDAVPAWTLAGLDAIEAGLAKPYFDYPSRSYGERLSTGESFAVCLEGEEANHWSPARNNGYGFVYDIGEYRADRGTFTATWSTGSGERLQLFGIADPADRLFAGKAPSLTGDVTHPIMVWRSGGRKTFHAVMQTFDRTSNGVSVVQAERANTNDGGATATAVRLSNGETDYWLYAADNRIFTVATEYGEWQVGGRCAWIRTDAAGRLTAHALPEAEFLRYRGEVYRAGGSCVIIVHRVDAVRGLIELAADADLHAGEVVNFRSKRTGAISSYRIRSVNRNSRMIELEDSVVLSKGIVEATMPDGRIESRYPLPLASDLIFPGAPSPFEGKMIVGESGGSAVIRRVVSLKVLEAVVIRPFRERERFDIVGVEPGDELRVPGKPQCE